MQIAALIIAAAAILSACNAAPQEASQAASSSPSPQPLSLKISGMDFFDGAGTPFEWRGVTAFRLAEMIASGNETDAIAFLDWARREQLTVVRVLLTARHLFKLTPEDGRRALPRLLDLARERGLAVEIVALADTEGATFDYEAHLREVGRIAAEKGNVFVEVANEPGHPTQDRRLHDPAFVAKLASVIPEPVIVALGSVEYGEGYGAGDYVTFHSSRGAKEWDHVLGVTEGARLVAQFRKPVVSDEPIGAHSNYQQGRRDNEPSRFAAAAALTRFAGAGATFHYEGGLQATVPWGREAACFAAWAMGLSLVGRDVVTNTEFRDNAGGVARVDGVRHVYARVSSSGAYLLLIDPSPEVSVQWTLPLVERRRSGVPGVRLVAASR